MTNLTHENIFFTKLFGVLQQISTGKSVSCADETRAKCPVSNVNIVTELYNITRNTEIKTMRVLSFVKNLSTTYLFRIPVLFEYCT